MTVEVSEIHIKVGKKELVLSPDEAKELRDALSAVVGEKTVERIYERDHYYDGRPYIWRGPYWGVFTNTTTIGKTGTTYTIGLNAGNNASIVG